MVARSTCCSSQGWLPIFDCSVTTSIALLVVPFCRRSFERFSVEVLRAVHPNQNKAVTLVFERQINLKRLLRPLAFSGCFLSWKAFDSLFRIQAIACSASTWLGVCASLQPKNLVGQTRGFLESVGFHEWSSRFVCVEKSYSNSGFLAAVSYSKPIEL